MLRYAGENPECLLFALFELQCIVSDGLWAVFKFEGSSLG